MPIPTARIRKQIVVGQSFGKMTVIRFATDEERINHKLQCPRYIGNLCFCRCYCGKEKIVKVVDLNRGHVKSCGCNKYAFARKNKLAYGEAALNDFWAKYKKSASERKLDFDLSKEQFEKLIKENCFYCGLEPRENSKNKWYNGSIVANGIDRVDNQKGYSVENCVPCCRQCNFAKRDLSIEDFKNWATKLVNNLNSKEF